ncbi:peptidoglycan binding protein CsiV [Shewanella sp. 4_MG-2023]|uniref:peptidoglycan binding protein CsiV n=1 Tax=Shewanella sp. 4_MG-2023 TaxID=3062652 RepID=UPI0026E2C747|nr:peptidoglycan binding protein CsiV [Shewanella sp. 4_MG-2023]MDO6677935.1 peptidoglycan binding protein CsiV [Shewanella sp. 4_MG-2023]
MLRNIAFSIAAISALSTPMQAQAKTWFEVEVYVFERQTNSVEKWQDDNAAAPNRKNIDLITPMISNDITGVALGLNGCTSTDWSSSEIDCQDPLVSANKTAFPSQVPFSIAAASEQQAYLGDGPVLLAESQSEFGEIIQAVRRESNMRSLLHLTWQQDMQSRNRAKPIRIFAGKDYSEDFEYSGNAISEQVEDEFSGFDFNSSFASLAPEPQTTPVWELDGNINIYLSHYLFIETNLALRQPIQKQTASSEYFQYTEQADIDKVMSPFLQSIPMVQNRRVRSGEIHYFDHPRLGIVMQIRKMEQPTETRPVALLLDDTEINTAVTDTNLDAIVDAIVDTEAESGPESMVDAIVDTEAESGPESMVENAVATEERTLKSF